MSAEVLMFVFAQVATAGGVYAAIKADLRELRVRVEVLGKAIDRQDREIDELLDRRWGRK